MMKLWKYILPLIAVVVFASCSLKDEAEVIPRNTLADIYVDMFMTDQWISSTPGMRVIADTSLVYEPILQKYGYDKFDYIHSVDFYMNDPERFARILRTSMDKLDKRIVVLQKLKKQQDLHEAVQKKIERFRKDYSFEEYFPYLSDEPYVHYYDSSTVEVDSAKIYRIVAIETADTLYDRLRMIVKNDSLFVADSIPVVDTLIVNEEQKPVVVNTKLPFNRVERPMKKDSVGRITKLSSRINYGS